MVLQHLRRVRWAVRATLFLGVAASVVANVLHALDNPISQAIAAWPPLALLLTVELISRVPVHRRWLAAARLIATATIAGIAAWVSYWHMVGVAARYGETGASPYLLPLSVDGLIVVASICLVELGGRITSLERDQDAQPTPGHPSSAQPAPSVSADPVIPDLIPTPAATVAAMTARTGGLPLHRRAFEEAAAALPRATGADGTTFAPTLTRQARPPASSIGRAADPAGSAPPPSSARPSSARPSAPPSGLATSAAAGRTVSAAVSGRRPGVASGRAVPAQRGPATGKAGVGRAAGNGQVGGDGASRTEKKETAGRARRSPAETVALAERLAAERPSITDAEIAAELGITTSRLRTVRRETQGGDHTLAA
ncbi:hypothetical protein GCM10010172_37350 [Paractinoplanes ferrugineus]|uniref:DUF2637 domain-containing protein n=1 Tax=Paractinoplanes ferrugineus TaxID=113564 RepID=A0A919MIP1_9ACTN|nr:DUF2637 domain-containing protein [Actinoplanes ferrugineus]GIE09332.1 hypothetical protein Afe05nite_11720 [Actinoplanes ferrugineus]